MHASIKDIWIESEEQGTVSIGKKGTDDNSDVIVTLHDGKRYIATFFTYENIQTLTQKNKLTGENLSGSYFWASDMVLIDTITRENIIKVIGHFIETNTFEQIFTLLPE